MTYGERPGLESQYLMIAALDGKLGSHIASGTGETRAPSARPTWTEVR